MNMAFLMRKMKELLIRRQHKQYEKAVEEQKLSYNDWIEKKEKEQQIEDVRVENSWKCLTNEEKSGINEGKTEEDEGNQSFDKNACRKCAVYDKTGHKRKLVFLMIRLYRTRIDWDALVKSLEPDVDAVLFVCADGEISRICLPLLYQELAGKQDRLIIYGDEDVRGTQAEGGVREKPWFKPDWSPDTFLTCFYFGSLTVIRAQVLRELSADSGEKPADLYKLCFRLLERAGCFRQRFSDGDAPVFHVPEILFHGKSEGYEQIKELSLPEKALLSVIPKPAQGQGAPLVSIVIPSRDNPGVLFCCIDSLLERTEEGCSFEILIIDNGSTQENQRIIQEKVKERAQEIKRRDFCGIRYDCKPMEFNFSRMCNLGAAQAAGELFLFLNDDMEILQKDWLTKLACKALMPYAGAVGAKLLYPDSDIIQHAGITNLRVGPAHKLQYLSDRRNHYYGKNRGVHDMLAATGACLMMRREVFLQAGGFFEGLAVAFNDVDLCYTIYENGFYNMVRNDVILYHHESLSRGKDGESSQKQQRLLKEKDILYERHQDLYGTDPFYHKYLTSDMLESEYSPAFRYQVRLDMPWAKTGKRRALPAGVREDACVVLGMECAMDIYKWKYGVAAGQGREEPDASDMGYYFQGYCFVVGADNGCYKRTLILQNRDNGEIIRIPVESQYRRDICDNLKDQVNVELTGFAAKVRIADVPRGCYRFGMLAEKRFSRQRLVGFSSWMLQVEEEENGRLQGGV